MPEPTSHAALSSAPWNTAELIDYQAGAIVSRQILKQKTGSVTLFAFDAGESLSEHTTSFDAVALVLDGRARITIGGAPHVVATGQSILMPAGIPHAVAADERFKMLLMMLRGE
ncbi:MAG TPA: cupin domain-containing protein [Candidatus Sumerlaeota bacterium]|nr:cupin domain-containing protein [Candidatus Sumerlaeota bacterium]HOR29211.1 cupin domain-containing protein [Candidatus Sumerlaeota bacterium]